MMRERVRSSAPYSRSFSWRFFFFVSPSLCSQTQLRSLATCSWWGQCHFKGRCQLTGTVTAKTSPPLLIWLFNLKRKSHETSPSEPLKARPKWQPLRSTSINSTSEQCWSYASKNQLDDIFSFHSVKIHLIFPLYFFH